MKFKNLTLPVWLLVMLVCSDVRSQSIDVTTMTGLNLFPKRQAQQYTPHIWLTAAYGDQFKFGFTGFANTDCFERTWPEQGTYRQIRKQQGFGVHMAFAPRGEGKLHPELFTSMGTSNHNWTVESSNPYLTENVLPREDLQSFFFIAGFRLRYEIKPWLHGIAGLNLGENNVQLGIRYSYAI